MSHCDYLKEVHALAICLEVRLSYSLKGLDSFAYKYKHKIILWANRKKIQECI